MCSDDSRIFVQESVYDEFDGRLVEDFERVIVASPLDLQTQTGAQVNEDPNELIKKYVKIDKEEEGETLLVGGSFYPDGELCQRCLLQANLT